MYSCQFCKREFDKRTSYLNHQIRCPSNPGRKVQTGRSGKAPWNKGLTKADSPSLERPTLIGVRFGSSLNGHSEKTRQRLSKIAKDRGLGGHTSKKKMYYKTISGEVVYLQSSYEVKFATLLDDLGVEWARPEPLKWIDTNGIDHKYYPDFQIGDVYFDTKNDYLAIKDADKINRVSEQNGVTIYIVTYNNITMEYIESHCK